MNWVEIAQTLFTLVVIPLLGILTKYLTTFIETKAEEIKTKSENQILNKYVDMAKSTVLECVIATNQTYVEAIKDKDAFDKEAQKEAFSRTLNSVLCILSKEAQEYLAQVYGDLDTYLKNLIEATVNSNKKN